MHTPHPNPLDASHAIIYRNHQKSLAYFSHLAPLILFFFTKRQIQKGGGGGETGLPWYGGSAPLVLKKLFVGGAQGALKFGQVLANVLYFVKGLRRESEHSSDLMI